jgi:hypothetical protein
MVRGGGQLPVSLLSMELSPPTKYLAGVQRMDTYSRRYDLQVLDMRDDILTL